MFNGEWLIFSPLAIELIVFWKSETRLFTL
jgi:hypothetical protein